MKIEKENEIYKLICEQGVYVDKDELTKALKYDRDQYNKGYAEGFEAGMMKGAERTKALLKEETSNMVYSYIEDIIDNLVEEMVGEING